VITEVGVKAIAIVTLLEAGQQDAITAGRHVARVQAGRRHAGASRIGCGNDSRQ
jgi:hypothetical protein